MHTRPVIALVLQSIFGSNPRLSKKVPLRQIPPTRPGIKVVLVILTFTEIFATNRYIVCYNMYIYLYRRHHL